jgi:hypothetical protein
MIFAKITLHVPPYVEFREEGRGQKERMNRKGETNGKQQKEVNKDLHYKVTVEHRLAFLLHAYRQTC